MKCAGFVTLPHLICLYVGRIEYGVLTNMDTAGVSDFWPMEPLNLVCGHEALVVFDCGGLQLKMLSLGHYGETCQL